MTSSNIIEMIKLNINHQYRAAGHYKDYKSGDISVDLSLTSINDRMVMNHFIFK